MIMRKIILVLLIVLISFQISCKNDNNQTNNANENQDNNSSQSTNENEKIKIGLMITKEGLGDNSFNDMQYRGLIEVSREFSDTVEVVYVESILFQNDYEKLKELIEKHNCEFVITAGWERKEPIDKVSSEYPDVDFVLLDDFAVLKDNVSSIVFAQNEGSFIVGVLSALVTETNKIGFVGGMNIPVIFDFKVGFEKGLKYINPNIELYTEYISLVENNDFTGWESPEKAKEIADKMYNEKGVDVIYAVAGMSGNGVITSAKNNDKYVIGVDSNQDHMAKGHVLTSMMKRLDNALFDICKKYIEGEFVGNKDYRYGYEEGGVSITDMKYVRDSIDKKIINRIRELEEKLANNEIHVPKVFDRNSE